MTASDPDVAALADEARDRGLDLLAYDPRGHGGSSGESTVGLKEQRDVAAAARVALEATDRVVLSGASMGAVAILSYVASLNEPVEEHRPSDAIPLESIEGIVTVSCPSRWYRPHTPRALLGAPMTRTRVGRLALRHLLSVRVARNWPLSEPPMASITRVDVPVAMVHGVGDSIIHHGQALELFAAAHEPKWVRLVPEMGHGIGRYTRVAIHEAIRWMSGLAP